MELKRKPLQGVLNIIRFNWPLYLLGSVILVCLFIIKGLFLKEFAILIDIGIIVSIFSILVSLLVSFYVYDLSDLYEITWAENANGQTIANINAGFDETSEIFIGKFPDVNLTVCDFYNPDKHTEVSIRRSRKAYPTKLKTIYITTDRLPFLENTFDKLFLILSAHEIRDVNERAEFFKELNRTMKPSGQIYVTEHLRDFYNFIAYNIGFFHFCSLKSWMRTFEQADLLVIRKIKTTPFVTTFVLEKNGSTH